MLISNSEVKCFQTCERRHYYSFREKLAPHGSPGKALTRGIVGHEALEAYYWGKQQGEDKESCLSEINQVLVKAEEKYPEFIKEWIQLRKVLSRYVEYYWDETWSVLEIERQHQMILDNSRGINYGMRLDLLVENKGQIVLVDHKFVYDFYNDRELKIVSQLDKYMHTLHDNGIPVKKAVLNQVRYRTLKSEDPKMMFRRSTVLIDPSEQGRVMMEHNKVAQRIWNLKQESLSSHFIQTTMNLDKNTCGKCSFLPLCKGFLEGVNTDQTKKVLYGANEYAEQYEDVLDED